MEVTSFDFGSSWGAFWGHLGGLGAILEASWASWGRLDGVLGRLGVLGNAKERLTMLACVGEQDQDLRPHGHVMVKWRGWGRGGRIQEGGETKRIRI